MRMLRMGIDTHLITNAKALPLLLRGERGLVVEMTDGTAEYNQTYRKDVGFYYDLVKASVARITLGLTSELAGTSVTPVAVTPGWLRSEQMLENFGVTEANWRDATRAVPHFCSSESPTYVARGIAALAEDPDVARYAGRVLSSAELARTYGVTDTDGTRPDGWRYLVEVTDAGRPAGDVGYR
jgi:NAD(P)-dependent dehydrogenase (short-subunit alcohol dehydrogenase family)